MLLSFAVPLSVLALGFFGWGAHRLATVAAGYAASHAAAQSEAMLASQVGRLFNTVGSVADGIAGMLQAHPPAPADVLQAVRNAAIAQGVDYIQKSLPATIGLIGVGADVLAKRLDNDVAGKLLTATAAAVVGTVTASLTPALPLVPIADAAQPAAPSGS